LEKTLKFGGIHYGMELRLNGKYQKLPQMCIKVVNTHNNTLSFFPFVGSTTTNPIVDQHPKANSITNR
jgi:hypothetical protein